MRTAYIIYYEQEAQKNSVFIEMLRDESAKYDIELRYISFENVNIMSDSKFMKTFEAAVFVINRTREYKLSKRFENIKIKVFHSSKITELGNDKFKTYLYLKDYFNTHPAPVNDKEWIAETVLVKSYELKDTLAKYIGKDYVIKSVDGHGGSEVFLLKDVNDKCEIDISDKAKITCLQDMKKESNISEKIIYESLKGHDCVIQKRIDSDGNDIRVYVLFGKIYAAVLRHGDDGFKSNFSLGGSVSEYFPDENQKIFIEKIINAFGKDELNMAGIDFILTRDGRLIFNELEEMVGSRMLYKCSKHDIVKEYVEQIAKYEVNML